MQDVSEAVSEAVGTVLTEQENIVAEVEAEAEANVEAEEVAPDTEEVGEETEELEASDDDAEESDAEESDVEESEEEVEAAESDYVNVPVLEDELATSFTLRDAEGELEVPDVIVEYKANGEIRKDRLDKVVRLAQWGVANQERDEKTKQIESQSLSVAEERNTLAERLAEREEQLIRLLQEDDYYYNAREAFEQENTPEVRAQRAEQQVRDLQVSHEMQQINNEGGKFWESELEPAIGMIADALPTVSAEELAEKCVTGIQAFMELAPNGVPYVPKNRFDRVREYVIEDLAYWEKLKHEQRSGSESPAQSDAALKKLEKARVEAQKAKRLVGQKTKPVGRAGKTRSPRKQRRAATLDDAFDNALDSVLQHL